MNWSELTIDTASPVPIYRQLSQRIAAWIREGALPDGARLIPTRELADLLGLNRTTVSAAYAALEQDGLLKAHVGRGSFVCAPAGISRFSWEERFRTSPPDRSIQQAVLPADGEFINFSRARDIHAPRAFDALCRAARQELEDHAATILELGAAEGYAPLREILVERMRAAGIARDEDELLITSGCQQALDLIAKVLVPSGATVLLEDPVYPGARDLFLAAGAQVRGIPVGPAGISVADLEQELSRFRPRLLVLTPSFQNPTGATLPLEVRSEILRLAARFETPVVENDVYAGLRYRGEDPPTLKSLDSEGQVIYLRSFSKTAFAGLRVGWCVAPRPVARRLVAAKQLTDLHTDQLSQAVLYRLAVEGTLDSHVRDLRRHGAARLEAAVAACRNALPPGVEFTAPEGGMHLWLRLPEPLDSGELLLRARAEKVLFIPGRFFAVSRSHHGALRLTFAGLAPEQIRRGVAILGRLIRAQAPVSAGFEESGVPALV